MCLAERLEASINVKISAFGELCANGNRRHISRKETDMAMGTSRIRKNVRSFF